MTAIAQRMTRWLNPQSEARPSTTVTRAGARRRLLDDISDFFCAHDLDITDRNLGLVRAYIEGDRRVASHIEAALRDAGTVSDATMAELAEAHTNPLSPERLSGIADKLDRKLTECLRIVGQSAASARDYGIALDCEVKGFQADPIGTVERLITVTRDVAEATLAMETRLDQAHRETERLRSNLTRARREADHDHLTGLLNRRSFENRLSALTGEPGATSNMCIALCDIDRFKTINDEHGHDTGDRVLRYFGERLRKAVGDHAVIARYGGEEFVCLFERLSVADAMALLEAVRVDFEARPLVNRETGKPMNRLTFSAGLAPVDGEPRQALLDADRALYEAKRQGRNRLVASRSPRPH